MQPQRDISEVVTKNLLKSLLTGEDYMDETMEAIDNYKNSINIAKNLLKEDIELEYDVPQKLNTKIRNKFLKE